jgi:type I restriction enzyme S subunit
MLGGIRVLRPPLSTQSAIADWLDLQTGSLRDLARQKRRLVELQLEKRQAIISFAVRGGLLRDAVKSASSVEWLGEIPATWRPVRSRRLFSLRKEKACPNDQQLTASQAYGVIPQEEFEEREGRRVVQVIKDRGILKHVEPGDFVISMRSFQGGIERSECRGAVSSAYVVLVPSPAVEPRFFAYLLKSSTYIQALQRTSDLVRDGQALRFQNFSLVDLPLVPMKDQQTIAAFLDDETKRIDEVVNKVQASIKLLNAYRSALITAAVTGQIDVRTYRRDPEEVVEAV